MRLKFLWAALLALPVLAASLLHGRPFIRCCASWRPFPDRSELRRVGVLSAGKAGGHGEAE